MSVATTSTATAAPRGLVTRLPHRLRVVPSEPPLVDERHQPLPRHDAEILPLRVGRSAVATPVHGWLPVAAVDPDQADRERRTDAELRTLFGARRTPRAELPDPRTRAVAAVRVLLEVLSGDRPARQVAAWVSFALLTRLESQVAVTARRSPRHARMRSLHLCEPTESVAEVTAVVDAAGRARAVGLRLEGQDGRWIVTDLCVG